MRLLHVIPGIGGEGGAERSLAALSPFLACAFDFHIAYFEDRDSLASELRHSGATVHRLHGGTRREVFASLSSLVSEVHPDLVHTTLFDADLIGRVAALGHGVPTVSSLVNVHYGREQLLSHGAPRLPKYLGAWTAEAMTARSAVAFHALTGHVADVMGRRLLIPRRRIKVIPRGRSLAALGEPSAARRLLSRSRLGAHSGPLIVAAARHERQKGLDVLLEAIPLVLRRCPEARFAIGGRTGGETASLAILATQLGIEDHIQFLGQRDDVAELMCAADVWCVPSRWEGFGGILVEAMALRVPVVASDIGPIREVAGTDPVFHLVRPGDPHSLAKGLLEVLSGEEEVNERVGRAHARFLAEYTIDRVSEQMVDFFSESIAESRLTRRRRRPSSDALNSTPKPK